jgi:hypothetical protein
MFSAYRSDAQETARILRERIRIKGSKITDEEVRRGFLELLDPDTKQDVARILIFTDSTVSIFASRHRHSNSPELQCVLDELEITLMEFGIELTLKHLPGNWMIRLHVDAASRCNPGPLLAVRGPMDIHPYVIHEFGLTTALALRLPLPVGRAGDAAVRATACVWGCTLPSLPREGSTNWGTSIQTGSAASNPDLDACSSCFGIAHVCAV